MGGTMKDKIPFLRILALVLAAAFIAFIAFTSK